MKALKIILLSLAFITLQAHAKDDRNLAVNRTNNVAGEQRIALVIGNGAYTNSLLKNPVNDAKDMAKKLRGLGFDVIERSNLQTKQIGATLREFRSKLVPGAVALVFYAGHGLQIKGDNYLPAVDADINSEEDVPNQSLAVKQIMDVLDESKTRLNLVFLDACRNNPYARSFRSSERGLARVTAPSGTLISYATRPGSVAADGDGRNGLYTSKLLAQMDSNLQIEQALKRVVTAVKTASQGKQEPWMEGSIEGDFCFAGCNAGAPGQGATAQPSPAVIDPAALELDAWNTAREMNTEDAYQAYLADHADGRHARFAQAAINKLKTARQPAQIATTSTSENSNQLNSSFGKVYFFRKSNFFEAMQTTKSIVSIDGKLVGAVAEGSYVVSEVPVGIHVITGIDNHWAYGSRGSTCRHELNVVAGLQYFFLVNLAGVNNQAGKADCSFDAVPEPAALEQISRLKKLN